MNIGELQEVIRRLIEEGMQDLSDLIQDAQRLAVELLRDSAYNLEQILQYFEGAILELFILATIMGIDIENLLLRSLDRIMAKKGKMEAG